MTEQRTNPGLWYDAEKRPERTRSREFIPTRLIIAMFSLAGIALVLVSLSVFTGRAPTGQPKDAPVWRTQTMTITGNGNQVTVVEDTGRVLLDGNGGFIAVVLDGLERAREVARVEGNPPVTITQYENGRVSLEDPASGWQVELSSFGPGNLGTFRKMLNGE